MVFISITRQTDKSLKQTILPPFVEEIVKKIISTLETEKIILFGSFLSGKTTGDSDIDLLIIMETNLPSAERQRIISRLLYPRIAPLDIIVKTPEEIRHARRRFDPFINTILREGVVLYERF